MFDKETISSTLESMWILAIAILIFGIFIYIIYCKFLSDFNRLKYGKGTAMAWFPICNSYLIGKLTFNKAAGWVMLALSLSGVRVSTTNTYGEVKEFAVYGEATNVVFVIFVIFSILMIICAVVKYNEIKQTEAKKYERVAQSVGDQSLYTTNYMQQPVRQQVTQPPTEAPTVPPQPQNDTPLSAFFSNSPVENQNTNNNNQNNL